MRIYLTGHNSFGNRGCEALVRSTVALLRQWQPRTQFDVPSRFPEADRAQWPQAEENGVNFVAAPPVPQKLVQWARLCRQLPLMTSLPWPLRRRDEDLEHQIDQADLVLSIGGDNYSLDYDLASLASFVGVAETALARDTPVVLWGASVGPFERMPHVERAMREHLDRLSGITVRESLSRAYLSRLGLAREPMQVTDPAFRLQPEPVDAGSFWPTADRPVLGLNLSPLVLPQASATVREPRAALVAHAAEFVRRVLRRWDLSVLLVPHVIPQSGAHAAQDDSLLLRDIAAAVGSNPALGLAPAHLNAAQLKHLIGSCQYFIGARTHATIAALSSGVPTVSIAYSIKARGIHRDLFGHEDGVIEGRTLTAPALETALQGLIDTEASVRSLLAERMPLWKHQAARGLQLLTPLMPQIPETTPAGVLA